MKIFMFKNPWSIEKLFKEYLKSFKQPIQITRQIKGPIGQVKLVETLNEHYKDCTFRPKISQRSKDIERRKKEEAKIHLKSITSSFANEAEEGMFNDLGKNIISAYFIERSNTFDKRKIFGRKYSVAERNIEASRLNNWLNRS